jgi:hypothetical protein
VLQEIQQIHIEQGKEGEANRFALRNPAAARVYARLSEDDKAAIEKTINSSVQPENPPDIQRKYVYSDWVNTWG